jgi:hypothetical protein
MRSLVSFCCIGGLALVSLLVPARTAAAAAIEYSATDLADVTPGDDLWSYEYFVSGFAFDADQGFSVYFDPTLYSQLQDPPPSPADWFTLSIQPDTVLPDDGYYEAVALTPGPSLLGPFTLTVVWLGGPNGPGAQRFTIDSFDADGFYTELAAGRTTPRGVPEPALVTLLAAGGFRCWQRARRRRPLRH